MGVLNRTAQVLGLKGHTFVPDMSSSPLYHGSVHGLPLPGAIPAPATNDRLISNMSSSACGSSGSSGRSQPSTSVYVPGFPENRNQATVGNANTVHVIFSRENVLGQSSLPVTNTGMRPSVSMQGYPSTASWVTQFIPNSPLLANPGVTHLQQCHFPFAAASADKALPSIPSNFVNLALQQPQAVAFPVYAPAPYPVYLPPLGQQAGNQFFPVALEAATGLPVYRMVPPFSMPVHANSRPAVTLCSSSVGVGSPLTGNSLVNTVPCSSATPRESPTQSAKDHVGTSESVLNQAAASFNEITPPETLQSVSDSESSSLHLQQESTAGHVEQPASQVQARKKVARSKPAKPKWKVDEACFKLTTLLQKVLYKKKAGDYKFLIDHYRSMLEQEPNNTVTVTGFDSLLHFLKITESKFRANALTLEKNCLTLQALTEKHQHNILQDGERYKQVMRKKVTTEENIGILEEKLKGRCKQRNFMVMQTEIKELEAKLEALENEKNVLQEKWTNYEKTRTHTPLENHDQLNP